MPGPQQVDILIIGAGLAGLSAATRILTTSSSSKPSIIVLEARPRPGGRTYSAPMPSGEVTVDLGAAWINNTNQARMWELATRYGVEFVEQNTEGGVVLWRGGGEGEGEGRVVFGYGEVPMIDEETHAELVRVRDMVEADCQAVDLDAEPDKELDSVTFEEYLKSRNATRIAIQTATVWTRAMLGQEPEDISALFFLQYCKAGGGLLQMRSDRKGGGQHLRMKQGTQFVAKSLVAGLPDGSVRLEEKVVSVRQLEGGKVSVQSTGGVFEAKKVICAVPPTVLKDIAFDPPLPGKTAEALTSYKYGFYMKVMIRFRTPFWAEKGLCGLAQSFTGPAAIFRDTSVPADGKHVLTCFMAGKPGVEWSKLGAEERKEALLKQIGEVYDIGERVGEEFVESLDYQWPMDAFTGYGCPSPALAPGALSAIGTEWTKPVGGVHFAGTEFSKVWRGYMEGAVQSGELVAEEVLMDVVNADSNHKPRCVD